MLSEETHSLIVKSRVLESIRTNKPVDQLVVLEGAELESFRRAFSEELARVVALFSSARSLAGETWYGTNDLARFIETLYGEEVSEKPEVNEKAELSPERQIMLDLILDRYDQYLDKDLYTAESAPKHKVEEWLREDLTRLDKAKLLNDRLGCPIFAQEQNGSFCITEASKEVPEDVRNICYGPDSAEFEFGSKWRGRNALDKAKEFGAILTSQWLIEKLFKAGLIEDSSSSAWVLYLRNTDLEWTGDGMVKNGKALWVKSGNFYPSLATTHKRSRGLRCTIM